METKCIKLVVVMRSVNLWKRTQTVLPHTLPEAESTAAFVTICGKLEIPPVGGEAGHRFIQFRKQILRIFFNCSAQDAAVGWRG